MDSKSLRGGRHRWPAAGLLACALLYGCSPAERVDGAAADPHGGHANAAHSDHSPRFGGVVMMDGDLHFEVVAKRDGVYRVYFSDAMRRPLPAATVTEVVITVMRPNTPDEVVTLIPDPPGESWQGTSKPVASDETNVRVRYVHQDEPYEIDLPFAGFR